MPDTPTPAELLREWDRQIALRLLKDGSPWLMSNDRAALSRLSQVEQAVEPRRVWDDAECAAFVARLDRVNQDDHAICLRQLLKRFREVEQERDASDAVVAKRCAWTTYDSMDERAAVHAAIERHRSRQKGERT